MSQSGNGDSYRQNSQDSQLIINSLEQTIQQLQTALNLINQTNNRDNLPNASVVKNLVNSSNQLLNSLEKNSTIDPRINSLDDNLTSNQSQINDENEDWIDISIDENLSKKAQTSNQVKSPIKPKRKYKTSKTLINFIFITLAIIIISLTGWWLYNSDILKGKNNQLDSNLDFNTEINSQELVREKSPQITKIEPQEKTELNLNYNNQKNKNQDLIEEPNNSKLQQQDDLEIDSSNQTVTNNQNSQADSLDNVINDNLNIAKKSEQIEVKQNNIEQKPTEEKTLYPLTPEQNLIKNIEDKIVEITKNYEGDLIISIQVDFSKNYLLVLLSDQWYNLTENQQDELIKTIYSQAKIIDLNKLEIKDLSQNLLARSAVVGNQVIIINRYQ